MTRFLRLLPLVLLLQTANAQEQASTRQRFDYGKMWTFDRPPSDFFQEAYGLQADERWFERARLGALRIPGCSASFVSPHGLVLTNHHCARASVAAVTKDGETLLDSGFSASSLQEERPIPGFVAEQLVDIIDVTGEVEASASQAQTDAERSAAIQEAVEAIQERLEASLPEDQTVQVISLYHGGLYSAYVFRRFDDVRLVLAPELQMGYFGGDADNFTFPRYSLDFSLMRVYQNGKPYATNHFFPVSRDGAQEGDAVFAIGNPGSTFRLETVSQLEYRRDVLDAYVLNLINSRLGAIESFLAAHPQEATPALRNQAFGLLNAQKLYNGRMKALTDPAILGRKADAEAEFAAAIARDEALNGKYGGLFDQMNAVQAEQRGIAPEHGAFLSFSPGSALASSAERRALLVVSYLSAAEPARVAIRASIAAIPDLPSDLDRRLLAARLRDLVVYLGPDDPVALAGLNGQEPDARAEALLAGSVMKKGQAVLAALDSPEVLEDDPMVSWVSSLQPRLRDYQSAAAGLTARQQRIAARLGRARFDVYGTTIPPDATFSLRISDGVVQGYEYNGTIAPAFTTMFGMYDRHYGNPGDPEWALPNRWLTGRSELDLSTPLNFVSTADITGGNSGSAVVNSRLELVGLIFDGNIESLSGDFIYTDRVARSVAVDIRGILEAIGSIYKGEHLVTELKTGALAGDPAEAGSK